MSHQNTFSNQKHFSKPLSNIPYLILLYTLAKGFSQLAFILYIQFSNLPFNYYAQHRKPNKNQQNGIKYITCREWLTYGYYVGYSEICEITTAAAFK
jgi:hypothetical protein